MDEKLKRHQFVHVTSVEEEDEIEDIKLFNENCCENDGGSDSVPLGLTGKAVCIQLLMSLLANFSILSSGMGLGFPAITYQTLTDKDDPMALTKNQASWFASINAISCPIGGLLCSYVLDKYGRKKTLYTINMLSVMSWGIMAMSSRVDKDLMFLQLMVARCMIGIVIGLSSAPSAVYSAEIAHPTLRGRFSVITSVTIALGVLVIYVLGYFIPTNWRMVSGISCAISVASLILLIPIPETPTWLASKGRTAKAEKSLRIFKGLPSKGSFINPELQGEIDILIMNSERRQTSAAGSGGDGLLQNLLKPEVYRPTLIVIGFFAFQQLSGIFVVIVYAADFATVVHVSMDPFLCVVLIGIVRVIAGVIIGALLDHLGRKPPTIYSSILMAICMFALGICSKYPPPAQYAWIPTALLLIYVFTSTFGLLTIPFVMNAEIYPQKYRGFCSGLSIAVCYTICFVCLKLYPLMIDNLGILNVCILYGGCALISVLYVQFIVPETKGKTLSELENLFKSHYTNNIQQAGSIA